MEFKVRKFAGVYEIISKPFMDERGFFVRTFDDKLFNEIGLNFNWVQENYSRTLKRATVRGFHFQLPPYSETKAIRCVKGKILDVFVDLRKRSQSFGRWDSIELSEDNYTTILIPRGFAHGFCTLTDECHLIYKHDNYFNSDYYSGIYWDDNDLNIPWPYKEVLISEKDRNLMSFKDFCYSYGGI